MPRKKYKFHIIYKTINIVNNKFYIGMHSTSNLNDGYLGSGKYLKYSINKHGRENFKCSILEFCENRIQLKEREKIIVNDILLKDPLCMNLTYGGDGNWEFLNSNSDIQRKKAIKSNAKQKKLRETDPEWVKKNSENHSQGLKNAYESGNRERKAFFDWTDKTHSNDTKSKIGTTNSIKQKGELNSQYGTCWITKEGINKKINKLELQDYINLGWVKGRK